ncbi:unnamed protein product [Calypogeia fissa]
MAMDHRTTIACLTLLSLWSSLAVPTLAQNSVVTNGYTLPPFQIEIWASNVTGARGLVIDDAGDALVVATGLGGIYAFWEEPNGQVNSTLIVNNSNLNHGITIYGNHLYASSSTTVWRWSYKAGQRSTATGEETIIVNISQDEQGDQTAQDHKTRSLAIGTNQILYVSVGSTSNVDTDSFRARIRSFNLTTTIPNGGFDFVGDGVVFADGLRNEVGLGFDGKGQLWGVENGADQLNRTDLGGDIHNNNPAEELNLFNGKRGTFYGYPFCWSEYNLPKFGTGPGSQWAWPTLENGTITDSWCKNVTNVRPPELAMQAHSAPLGITFYDGTNCGTLIRNSTTTMNTSYSLPCEYSGDAFVTFHGSWDRDIPVGYKVVRIAFDNGTGLPIGRNDSSIFDVFGALNSQTACVGSGQATCLRPVDVKFDKLGALLVTLDATGEIIRVTSSNVAGVGAPAPSPAPPSSAPQIGSRVGILLRAFAPTLVLYVLSWHSEILHGIMM